MLSCSYCATDTAQSRNAARTCLLADLPNNNNTINMATCEQQTSLTTGTLNIQNMLRLHSIISTQRSCCTYIILSSSEVLQQLVSLLAQLSCLLPECISLCLGTSCITPGLPANKNETRIQNFDDAALTAKLQECRGYIGFTL